MLFSKRHFEHFAKNLKAYAASCTTDAEKTAHNVLVLEVADLLSKDGNKMNYERFCKASGIFVSADFELKAR